MRIKVELITFVAAFRHNIRLIGGFAARKLHWTAYVPQSHDDLIVAVNVFVITEQGCLMPKCLPEKTWQFRTLANDAKA